MSLREAVRQEFWVTAIKNVRFQTGLGVIQAKHLVDANREAWRELASA
jgi:ribosomal protein L7/L12